MRPIYPYKVWVSSREGEIDDRDAESKFARRLWVFIEGSGDA
jgi:hypothetical protein